MVESKQDQLDKTARLTDGGYFKVAVDLSLELSEEIARYYFPKSKFPIYELSIQEMLNLNHYITKRVEELMNGRFFKLFKKFLILMLEHIKEVGLEIQYLWD